MARIRDIMQSRFCLIRFRFLIITLLMICAGGSFLYAASQDEEINAVGAIALYEVNKFINLPSAELKELHKFQIVEKNGKYFWASNGNKPLIKTQRIIKDQKGREVLHWIFVNPDGEGQIIIKYIPSNQDFFSGPQTCDQSGINYTEYRLNERGTLTPYQGATKPFPYPKAHICKD